MCQSASSWPCAAASGAGWQCPSETTAIPASRSRYRLPSASVSQTPSPETKVTSCRAYAGRSDAVVSTERHATTAVAPIVASTPPRVGDDGGVQLRHDPAAELARGEQALGLRDADGRGDRSAEQQPGDVGDEEEPVGAEPDRERGRRLVGVHVQRPDGERRDDGDEPGRERVLDRRQATTAAASRRARARGRARLRARSRRRRAARPAGRSPRRRPALTAAKESRTTASAAALVTRRPSTNRTSSPARSSSAEICGPAPWTTQTSCCCASASASVAASPATAPPTLSTIRLMFGSPR